MANENTTLKEEIHDLSRIIKESLDQGKPKKFRSIRTRLPKRQLRKGKLIVVEIKPNKGVTIRKEPIIDGVVKLTDTYHAIKDLDVFLYEPVLGKSVPMVFIPKHRLNPWNPIAEQNETYGQSYVMAKMNADEIKQKKQFSTTTIIVIVLILIGGFYYLSQSGAI